MAMIIKKDTGIVKCAATNEREKGDLYINDALHYNLAMFFAFAEEDQVVLQSSSVKIEEVEDVELLGPGAEAGHKR